MNNTTVFLKTDEMSTGNITDTVENTELKRYLLLVIFIQALLSTVGNLIIFLMTVTMPTLRKTTSMYFILCLSFSDLLVGSSSIDHYFQSNLDVIPLWRCLISTIISLSAILISLVQTFLICFERILHVIHFPHTSSLLTDKNRTFTIAATWLVCAVYICVLVLASYRDCPMENNTIEDIFIQCTLVVNGFATVFVPIYVGIIIQYTFLLYKIRKLYKSVQITKFVTENQNERAMQNSSLTLFKDIFKTLSVFVLIYIVSFGPFAIFFGLQIFFGIKDRNIFASVIALLSFNGVFSPLLYIWRFKEMRSLFEC